MCSPELNRAYALQGMATEVCSLCNETNSLAPRWQSAKWNCRNAAINSVIIYPLHELRQFSWPFRELSSTFVLIRRPEAESDTPSVTYRSSPSQFRHA